MILKMQTSRSLVRRPGFSLLEILVVVAIMIILASVASVYFFGYLDDTEIKTGKSECAMFEEAAKSWMLMNRGADLSQCTVQTLVQPSSGNPLVAGGAAKMFSPLGQNHPYNLTWVTDSAGNPDPICTFTGKDNVTYSSPATCSKYPGTYR